MRLHMSSEISDMSYENENEFDALMNEVYTNEDAAEDLTSTFECLALADSSRQDDPIESEVF